MDSKKAKDKIIVALDVDNLVETTQCVEELAPHVGAFKVGLELITGGFAPTVVRNIRAAGGSVFYDAKFGDIPNTMAAAARRATRLGAAMFTVHTLCGHDSMKAAAESAKKTYESEGPNGAIRPLVLGVTILTSLSHEALVRLDAFGFRSYDLDQNMTDHLYGDQADMESLVARLARAAQESGLDGVIASPKEIHVIRHICGPDFLIVTPGVRPAGAAVGDQSRVMTPGEAIKAGANYLVIGRPILKPENGKRVEAAQRIAEEIASVL